MVKVNKQSLSLFVNIHTKWHRYVNESELNRIPLEGRDENTLSLVHTWDCQWPWRVTGKKTQWCEQTDGWRGDGRCTDGRERRNLSAIHSLPLSPVKKHLVPQMRCLSAPIQEKHWWHPPTHTHITKFINGDICYISVCLQKCRRVTLKSISLQITKGWNDHLWPHLYLFISALKIKNKTKNPIWAWLTL